MLVPQASALMRVLAETERAFAIVINKVEARLITEHHDCLGGSFLIWTLAGRQSVRQSTPKLCIHKVRRYEEQVTKRVLYGDLLAETFWRSVLARNTSGKRLARRLAYLADHLPKVCS
jgi:hypothetical protein